jgi:hypothetical protein
MVQQRDALFVLPVLPVVRVLPEKRSAGGRTRTADPALMRRVLLTN